MGLDKREVVVDSDVAHAVGEANGTEDILSKFDPR
jgi:hypothetical protein